MKVDYTVRNQPYWKGNRLLVFYFLDSEPVNSVVWCRSNYRLDLNLREYQYNRSKYNSNK